MNPAHLHLLLNHLPVIGMLGVILVLAAGVLRGSQEVVRVGLWLGVLVAVAGLGAYLTGEPAEEMVERLPGIAEPLLEAHEEAALVAVVLGGVFGAGAAAGLVVYRRRIPRWFALAALLASLVPAAAMVWTANLGGRIRHPELGGASTATAPTEASAHEEEGER